MQEVWQMLQRGGIIMIPLFLCSIIAVAVLIEKLITLRKRKIIIPEIVSVIENIKSAADIDLALSICDQNKGVFSNIIKIGLKNIYLSKEEMREMFQDQGRQEVRTLQRGLGILETIASIAP